ncbi:MAG: hypothetical protein GC160_21615 [Acidobacteria bacterium]|nr:hypothetical protein [Acidobacteriota bacterium]
MTAATERKAYGASDLHRRFERIEVVRRSLAVAAGPFVRRVPAERLPGALCRAAVVCDWLGRRLRFQPADALDPDLRGLSLRELVRACRTCGRPVSFDVLADNEEALRKLQAEGRKTLWCGMHHALAGAIPLLFESWGWPSACLTAQRLNPSWGDFEGCQPIRPSSIGLLELRRAIEHGKATIALLDAGRQSRRAALASPGLLGLARRLGATPVAFRIELDADAARLRVRTQPGPSPGQPAERYLAEARAAVEALYGDSWGMRVVWSERLDATAAAADFKARAAAALLGEC